MFLVVYLCVTLESMVQGIVMRYIGFRLQDDVMHLAARPYFM
jgi:hypothetical protein